jgi:hypothetical protein
MAEIARAESNARSTAVAQRNILSREVQDIRQREQAEKDAKKRPRTSRKYEGGYLTNEKNTAIRKQAQEEEAEAARAELAAADRKADEQRALEEQWEKLHDDPNVKFHGKLDGSRHSKPVLQGMCFLLGLDTSSALTKAELINSIKTAIATSTDLQEDSRFCDLDWDNSGRGRRKRRKFAKAPEAFGAEDGDNDEDVVPMDNEGEDIPATNNQSNHGALGMHCPCPSSCSLPLLASPLLSTSLHIRTTSPVPFTLRSSRPLPARLMPRSPPNATHLVALPSSPRPPEPSVLGPLRIAPRARPAYQGASINKISISSLAAPPSTPRHSQPPRMAPWSPYRA